MAVGENIISAFAVIGPLAASIIKGAFFFLALPDGINPQAAAGIILLPVF